MENNKFIIDLSWQGIFRLFFIFLLGVSLWYFRGLILLVLVSFVIALFLENPINFLNKKIKFRWACVLIVYLLLFISFAGLLYLAIPALLDAVETAITKFHILVDYNEIIKLLNKLDWSQFINKNWQQFISSYQDPLTQLIFKFTNLFSRLSGGAFSFFFVLLVTLFFNIEFPHIENTINIFMPQEYRTYALYLFKKTKLKINKWFYSQLILSTFVGILNFIGFRVLNVPSALFLSLLAAILDFIPYFGPTLAGFIAVMFGFSSSFVLGISVLIYFILVQGLENVIAPFLRARSLNLSPLLIILSLVIGQKLAGILGLLIALPVAAVIAEFFKDYYNNNIKKFTPQKELDI